MKSYSVKKPLQTVNAVQYLGKSDQTPVLAPRALPSPSPEHPNEYETFAGWPMRYDPSRHLVAVLVQTSAGGVPVFPGDWIVEDGAGKVSVFNHADFAAKHEGVVSGVVVPYLESVRQPVPLVPYSTLTQQQLQSLTPAQAQALAQAQLVPPSVVVPAPVVRVAPVVPVPTPTPVPVPTPAQAQAQAPVPAPIFE